MKKSYPLRQNIFSLLVGGLLFSTMTCDVINPDETIPSYIYIDELELTTSGNEGSSSNQITEVWLTADDDFLGTYRLPSTIPILKTGDTEITLNAGIKRNGISAAPDIYPFYAPFQQTIALTSTEVDTIRPTISYEENTVFEFVENYENQASVFGITNTGNPIEISSEEVFEGQYAGKITIDEDNPTVELVSSLRFDAPAIGASIYLELNYKSEMPVVFGIIGYQANSIEGVSLYDPGFLPNTTWNKIYFDLSEFFLTGEFEEFHLVFRGFVSDGVSLPASAYLDNIKLLQF